MLLLAVLCFQQETIEVAQNQYYVNDTCYEKGRGTVWVQVLFTTGIPSCRYRILGVK